MNTYKNHGWVAFMMAAAALASTCSSESLAITDTSDEGSVCLLGNINAPAALPSAFPQIDRSDAVESVLASLKTITSTESPSLHILRRRSKTDLHPHTATSVHALTETTYKLGNILGEGGFATVYHATTSDGQDVALKCVDTLNPKKPGGLALSREFEFQLAANHPYVMPAMDFLKYNTGHECIVMELAANGSMKSLLKKDPVMKDGKDLKRLFYRIMKAFQQLHRIPIAHRMFSPILYPHVMYDCV